MCKLIAKPCSGKGGKGVENLQLQRSLIPLLESLLHLSLKQVNFHCPVASYL